MTKQKLGAYRLPLTQFRRVRHGDLARHHWRASYRLARFDAMLDPKANRKLVAFRGFGTVQDAATAQTIQRRWQPWAGETAHPRGRGFRQETAWEQSMIWSLACIKSVLWTAGRTREAAADRQRFILLETFFKGATFVTAAQAAGFPAMPTAMQSLIDGNIWRRVGIPHPKYNPDPSLN